MPAREFGPGPDSRLSPRPAILAAARVGKGEKVVERQQLNEAVLTVVVHLAAAGVNVAAGITLGAQSSGGLAAALLTVALGIPVAGLSLGVLGRPRTGALLLILSYVGAAGLGLFGLLRDGVLITVLNAPPETWWRPAFFVSALMLPLVQIRGILEASTVLFPAASESRVRRI